MLDKYGDIYGRERIAELLGMDLASLDVSAMTHEKKAEPDTSMFSWYALKLLCKTALWWICKQLVSFQSVQDHVHRHQVSDLEVRRGLHRQRERRKELASYRGEHVDVVSLTADCPLALQTFLYLVWYMLMSMLGHYNNFFFAAHLLDIAMGVKTLRTILSSVTHNGKQVRTA